MKIINSKSDLKIRLDEYISSKIIKDNILNRFNEWKWFSAQDKGLVALNQKAEISFFKTSGNMHELWQEILAYGLKNNIGKFTIHVLEGEEKNYLELGFEEIKRNDHHVILEYLLANNWLGKCVHVEIDQPYGHFHPYLENVILPVNIGYVYHADNMLNPINAYVVGVDEALSMFDGVVVAVIYHEDSDEPHLVVTQLGRSIDKKKILKKLSFQEQYFKARIVWL